MRHRVRQVIRRRTRLGNRCASTLPKAPASSWEGQKFPVASVSGDLAPVVVQSSLPVPPGREDEPAVLSR